MNSPEVMNGIAIIGMAGRFPGAPSVQEFWRNIRDGVESIRPLSDEELLASGVSPALLKNPNYIKVGAVVEDIDLFDADFFGYNPREAESIDPQQRVFLECAWTALENAGYDPETFQRPIAVFAGAALSSYLFNWADRESVQTVGSLKFLSGFFGNALDYLCTRVAYKLNLKGPAVTVQSACSTAGVAIHMARQSLLNYQCDMALAGGVSLRVPQKAGYLAEGGMVSQDGHCRSFDAEATGTVFGNGAGVVVLKRLADALADGDHIYAVIASSAVNNDGSAKIGYTAPSVDGQAEVIAEALAWAGIKAESISYVEAHGTATPIGDPIEITALNQAYRLTTDKTQFCAIGSVKTNIGHLDAAAGVASVIKVAQALDHKLIPPSLHFHTPNPKIDFENSPFFVNTTLREWQSTGGPRRAGVSTFGVGGTNAHLILEEAPRRELSGPGRPWNLVLLSGRTETALKAATENLARHLRENPHLNTADVAYTLQVGRRHFGHRRAVLCSASELVDQVLEQMDPKKVFIGVERALERPITFMFPGQSAQYENMTRELYETEAVFRECVDTCSMLLGSRLGVDLRMVLFPGTENAENEQNLLNQTYVTQPALFVIEYALARQLMAWGIQPDAMIGHSVGEYVAACLAGVMSLEDALMLVAERGRLMQSVPTGAMLSVHASAEQVAHLLTPAVSLAAVNGPKLCVVAAETKEIAELERRLAEEGISCTRLHTSHAFHSHMMDPILEEFARLVARVPLQAPTIRYISNVTGTWITPEQAVDPKYWANHLRGTVRFSEGMQELLADANAVLLEVGPGQALSTFARQQFAPQGNQIVLQTVRHIRDQESDSAVLLRTLGRLWVAGVQIDWAAFHAGETRYRIPLPTYPFERRRYWIAPADDQASAQVQAVGHTGHPLLGERLSTAPPIVQFRTELDPAAPTVSYMNDHRIRGVALVPGTAYVDVGLKAAAVILGEGAHSVAEVQVSEALYLLEDQPRQVQVTVLPEASGAFSYRVYSRPVGSWDGEWVLNASGSFRKGDAVAAAEAHESPASIRERCDQEVTGDEYYRVMHNWGYQFGPMFQGIKQLWRREGESIGVVELPEELLEGLPAYELHPAFLDACVNVLAPTMPNWGEAELTGGFFIPSGCRDVRVFRRPGTRVWVHAVLRVGAEPDAEHLEGDIYLLDDEGHLIAMVEGWRGRRLGSAAAPAGAQGNWLYRIEWEVSQPEGSSHSDMRESKRWLLLADQGGAAAKLAAVLEERGDSCVLVNYGSHLEIGVRDCTVRPHNAEDFKRLIAAKVVAGKPLAGVVHLWSLDATPPHEATRFQVEQDSQVGAVSLLRTVQAMVSSEGTAPPPLWIVTRGAQAVFPEQGAISVAQAPVWGMSKVIAFEHPELHCRVVDLDPSQHELDSAGVDLLAGVMMNPDAEDQLAFRGATRYVPRLSPCQPSTGSAPQATWNMHADVTYLITGGLGGLGTRVAQRLVERGARHLVLVGRGEPSEQARAALGKLEAAGVNILAMEVDVAEHGAVAALLERIADSMPPLAGIVHAAGIVDGTALVGMTEEGLMRIMAPKVTGTWNLHSLTKEMPLDFFICFSSTASVIANPGQAHYAAANAFLDAFAHYRRAQGLVATSINWGPWGEVGMAARRYKDGKHLADQGVRLIPPERGLAYLEQIVTEGMCHVTVLPTNPRTLFRFTPQLVEIPMFSRLLPDDQTSQKTDAGNGGTLHPRPSLATTYVAPRTELERVIAAGWEKVLGIEQVGVHDSFFELGGHSLLAPQVLTELRQSFPIDIPLRLMFEASTVAELADRVGVVLMEKVERMSEEEAAQLLELMSAN